MFFPDSWARFSHNNIIIIWSKYTRMLHGHGKKKKKAEFALLLLHAHIYTCIDIIGTIVFIDTKQNNYVNICVKNSFEPNIFEISV